MKTVIIAGPTAAGKSGVAMRVAERFGNVEIISADAFQVYRGLDIGTAKASVEEREMVKHHLIDIMPATESYTAGRFSAAAESLIEEVRSRGNTPIVVGGTGLYIKTLTDGIFDCPPIDTKVRDELHERVARVGLSDLYAELKVLDPEYAAKISENDPVRIVRALEVSTQLGIPFTEAHRLYHQPPKYDYDVFILEQERSILYGGINKRAELMWKAGWPLEVKKLLSEGVTPESPAFRAIGYKDIADFILKGGGEHAVIDNIAKQTRHFAKRQLTWFHGMDDVNFYKDADILFDNVVKVLEK